MNVYGSCGDYVYRWFWDIIVCKKGGDVSYILFLLYFCGFFMRAGLS